MNTLLEALYRWATRLRKPIVLDDGEREYVYWYKGQYYLATIGGLARHISREQAFGLMGVNGYALLRVLSPVEASEWMRGAQWLLSQGGQIPQAPQSRRSAPKRPHDR